MIGLFQVSTAYEPQKMCVPSIDQNGPWYLPSDQIIWSQ